MHSSTDRAPREDVLTTAAAAVWLAERGVSGDGPSHLIADEVAAPGFRAARIWHAAARLERMPTPGVLLAVLIVDGDVEAAYGGVARSLTAGDLVVAPDGELLELRSSDRTARFEFEVRSAEPALTPTVAEALRAGIVVTDAAPSFRPILLAAVNAAFNAGLSPDAAGFAAFRLAATSLLAGLLDESLTHRVPGRSSSEALLHRQALETIAVNATDRSFSVAALARTLAVSDRHLRRIFQLHGTSPAQALRDARRNRARAILDSPAPPPLGEVARLAGFSSARALRRAAP
jgi:AraC-like DNA-binding protein